MSSQPGSFERQLQRKGVWLAAALAIVLVAGGLWWIFHARHLNIPPAEVIKSLPPNIEFRLNHVTLRGISNGKIVWEVDADHFDLTKDQKSFVVGGLKKMALVKDGKQELTINADTLQQDIASGDINVYGHVMVTGKDLSMRMPGVYWSDRSQLLLIPQQLCGQLGDITVVAEKGARYDVTNTILQCTGRITVGYAGNILSAAGVVINGTAQQLTVTGPVHARLLVADLQQWAEGQNVPAIPDIPVQIKERYQEFCRKKGY